MRIILHADDFGQDDETVDATIECFHRGALTSATIMPKMRATARAIDFALKHPQFSFGVHLTYVDETPVLDPAQLSALTGPDGKFLLSQTVRKLAMRGRLPLDQIEAETTAQIALLHEAGIPLSHVDSHGHLHKFKPFVEALRKVLPGFGIKRVRTVQNIYIRRPLRSPTYWIGPYWKRRIERNFLTTDHLFMPTNIDDARAMADLALPQDDSTIEIGGHPGYSEPWRSAERQGLQSLAQRIAASSHHLITWNQV